MFLNEAWLRSVSAEEPTDVANHRASANYGRSGCAVRDCTWLESKTTRGQLLDSEICYRCQATELKNTSRPLPWWEPKQYVRDVCTNDVALGSVIRVLAHAAYKRLVRWITSRVVPSIACSLRRTPFENLGLRPGEWVVVKTKQEILATLDPHGCDRGLKLEAEMLPYVGKRYRVLGRVERIIDESTGRMR
jgi:hypothetical protein